jgi:hypothetical protein
MVQNELIGSVGSLAWWPATRISSGRLPRAPAEQAVKFFAANNVLTGPLDDAFTPQCQRSRIRRRSMICEMVTEGISDSLSPDEL